MKKIYFLVLLIAASANAQENFTTPNDTNMGSGTNSATVFASNLLGNTISDVSNSENSWDNQSSPTATPMTNQPQLVLEKIATIYYSSGTIFYDFYVTNTGDVTITDLAITDLMLSDNPISISPSTLNPGEGTYWSIGYSITAEDYNSGTIINSATVSGTTLSGDLVTDVSDDGDPANGSDNPTVTLWPTTYQPQLDFVKTATMEYQDEIIVYDFYVTNTGDVTITDLEITDEMLSDSPISISPSTLNPGETSHVSMNYSDITFNSGTIINSATVSGTTLLGDYIEDVSDDGDPANGSDNPTITLWPSLWYSFEDINYEDYNNDGLMSVGDLINYSLSVQNVGSIALYDIHVSAFYMIGNTIPVLLPGETDSTTFSAVQVLTEQDISNGYILDLATYSFSTDSSTFENDFYIVVPLDINDGIQLNAFIDYNSNGVKDVNEPNFPYGNFHYENSADGIEHNVATPSGLLYLYGSNPTTTYSLSYDLNAEEGTCGAQYTISTSSYNNVTIPDGSGITTYNFPITVIPCSDLEVFVYGTSPQPGFIYRNTIAYRNKGSQTIASGTVTFNKDGNVTIISTSPSATLNAGGFTYNFTNLAPLETRYIEVIMQVPTIPTVTLGQVLTNSASTTIPAGDINVANNEFQLSQTIIGSYDPNDKNEAHGPKIVHSGFTADDYLTYTIRFENTGTADAINVSITDILDEKLDETSVRTIAASGNYVMERTGSNLEWRFGGLNLPPSVAGTQIGHGYVVFQVKPKADYELGDVIPNEASIYFDFNPAVVTNTFTTEFVTQLGTEDFANNDFVFYPNPVQSKLSISHTEQIDYVTVYSMLGQVVYEAAPQAMQTQLDLSRLSSGTYLLKVKSGNEEKTVRFIKE